MSSPENPLGGGIWTFFFSISNVKVATNLKKETTKVQRQKTFFAQIQPAFI